MGTINLHTTANLKAYFPSLYTGCDPDPFDL